MGNALDPETAQPWCCWCGREARLVVVPLRLRRRTRLVTRALCPVCEALLEPVTARIAPSSRHAREEGLTALCETGQAAG